MTQQTECDALIANLRAAIEHEAGTSTCYEYMTSAVVLLTKQAQRIEQLEKDASRIEFLQSHPAYRLEMRKSRWSCVAFANYEYLTFKTAREAIDHASADSTHVTCATLNVTMTKQEALAAMKGETP
jgi:hypothetical protein